MDTTAASDTELLTEWVRHHYEPAFRALVSRYAALVHMAARRACGNETLAAEASQLTFILLARKAKSLTSHTSLAGWLHVTAVMKTRELIDKSCREHRKIQRLQTAMETESPSPPGDVWKEMQPVLDDALAALSDKDREALLLRFYRSLTVREIAATLGIGADAAQKRITRATDRLRRKLVRRGCQVGGSLSGVMLAGFAADAQAATLSVSMLASKAITASAAATGGISAATSILTLFTMKTTSLLVPLGALLFVGAGLGVQRHSMSAMKEENAVLAANHMSSPRATPHVVEARQTEPVIPESPIDWRNVAEQLVELKKSGDPNAARRVWYEWQQRLSSMSGDELAAEVDRISQLDLPEELNAETENLISEPLGSKAPGFMLKRFVDRLNQQRRGIGLDALQSALAAWASMEPVAAGVWFDEQIAAGNFEGKELNPSNWPYPRYEGHMIRGLLASDPAAAAKRLEAFPQNEREEILSRYKMGRSLRPEDWGAYAGIVRQVLPKESGVKVIADVLYEIPVSDDYSSVTHYLDKIHATPDERAVCVRKAAMKRTSELGENRKITKQDLDLLRKWVASQTPGAEDSLTGEILGRALHVPHPLAFNEAAKLATAFQEPGRTDEVIPPLVEAWNGKGSPDEVRALAGRITDEDLRNRTLNSIEK